MGFSHGWNLTEAINTLLPINASFLFNVILSYHIFKSLNQQKLPIFPYEWPLIGVLEKLGTVKFTRKNFGILFEEIKLVINREEILRKRKKGSIIRVIEYIIIIIRVMQITIRINVKSAKDIVIYLICPAMNVAGNAASGIMKFAPKLDTRLR